MREWRYRYHGLSVRSEIWLPEWSAFENPPSDSKTDSPLLSDETVEIHFESGAQVPPREGEYRFFAKHTGWFVIRGGREIGIPALAENTPGESDAAARRLRTHLLGSAWGALLYQRRALLLHASAVRAGSAAVAFCARRGAGKSTLAASLSTLGYPLVSDDLCCIRVLSQPPRLYPSMVRYRLCEDAVEKLGWKAVPALRDPAQSGKYHYYPVHTEVNREFPLRRIYLLGWGEPEIRRLRGFKALLQLASEGTWRRGLLDSAGDPVTHFSQCAHLLREVECWEFRRPRSLDLLDKGVIELVAHMSER
jgi:hypothetical protein